MKDHNMSPPKKKTVRGCYDSDPDCYEGGYKSDSDDRNYRKKKSVPRKKKALGNIFTFVTNFVLEMCLFRQRYFR